MFDSEDLLRADHSPDTTSTTKKTGRFKTNRPFSRKLFLLILVLIIGGLFFMTLMPAPQTEEDLKAKQGAYINANPSVALSSSQSRYQPDLKPAPETALPQEALPPEAPVIDQSELYPNAADFEYDYAGSPPRRSNPYMQDYIASQITARRASSAVPGWGNLVLADDIKKQAQAQQPTGTSQQASALSPNTYDALAKALGAAGSNQSPADQFYETGGGKDKGYLSDTRMPMPAPYVLPVGTMIPCALLSGINTDIPGDISAQVTSNVYDWIQHNKVLIPQGSRLFGRYNNHVEQGQRRAQVAWHRLVYPDGSAISLGGMTGTDRRGYAGLTGKYYPHYGRMFFAAILTGGLALLDEAFSGNKSININNSGPGTIVVPNSNDNSAGNEFKKAAAEALSGAFAGHLSRVMSQPPTIVVKPGTRFFIQLNADIPFMAAWRWR